MSEGEIPFSAIDRYALRYGIDTLDEFESFRKMIRHLDHLYLSTRNSKQSDTPTVVMNDVAGVKGMLKALAPAGDHVDLLALKKRMQVAAAREEATEQR